MNQLLPERPDWEQLKRQAKDLHHAAKSGDATAIARIGCARGTAPKRHSAQLTIAREYGFSSWAKLKLAVLAQEHVTAETRLVEALVQRDATSVQALMQRWPDLPTRSLVAACAAGDPGSVRDWLRRAPDFVRRPTGPRSWEPLLYVSFCAGLGDDHSRSATATALLGAGADPNCSWTDPRWPEGRETALYGAVGVNEYPATARVLLQAGADPNDGESRYHAAEHHHQRALKLLLEFGADFSGRDQRWGNTPLYFLLRWRNPVASARAGIRWLLDHGADPNVPSQISSINERPLHAAIRLGWEDDLIDALLAAGADPGLARGDGRNALDLAVRAGRAQWVRRFRGLGITTPIRPIDQLIGACGRADVTEADAVIARHPQVAAEAQSQEGAVVLEAAQLGAAASLQLMSRIGFDLNQADPDGVTALHWAAWHGHVEAVRTLVTCGVRLNAIDRRFEAPPIGWCAHGSHGAGVRAQDYAHIAKILVDAGAEIPAHTRGCAEVMAVLRQRV